MELVIVRHGRPEQVAVTAGTADPPLTTIGHQQAEAVSAALRNEQIDHIVSSPMLRAQQTAAPTVALTGLPVEIVDGLIEVDADATEYVPAEVRKATDPEGWRADARNPAAYFGTVGEAAFTETVVAAFEQLIADHPGQKLAVFCHGMVTSVFLGRVLGIADGWRLAPDYASLNRVRASTTHNAMSVRSFNETSHLTDLPDLRI